MADSKFIIPKSHKIHQDFRQLIQDRKLVVFSGLPGVGKSLYINEFYRIAQSMNVSVDLVQWDVARKAFETDLINTHYPMGDGIVHNGLKLIAGEWLMQFIKIWLSENENSARLLLVEAPLVGHRFIELVKPIEDTYLETFLKSDQTVVVMPIPTKKVRKAIEEARAKQVNEDAKVWFGAKPSVMQMLWNMTCDIAIELGYDLAKNDHYNYDPDIYIWVFQKILKHRHFTPLIIDTLFDVPSDNEQSLHSLSSFKASDAEANEIGEEVISKYPGAEEIDRIVDNWYNT